MIVTGDLFPRLIITLLIYPLKTEHHWTTRKMGTAGMTNYVRYSVGFFLTFDRAMNGVGMTDNEHLFQKITGSPD